VVEAGGHAPLERERQAVHRLVESGVRLLPVEEVRQLLS
jgi:hypothetical protein